MLNLGHKLSISTLSEQKKKSQTNRVGRLHAKAAPCRSFIKAGSSARGGVCHRLMSGSCCFCLALACLKRCQRLS